MRTEISKTYKSGFVLSEQELRRIIQACVDHASKITSGAPELAIEATLNDGAIIDFDKTDDLFTLENAGTKRIQKISIKLSGSVDNAPWSISVLFQDGVLNKKDWTSISFIILGTSRDWAFVTASDLEDRIKRIKAVSFEALLSNKWAVIWVMVASMVLMVFLTAQFSPSRNTHILLQKQYDAGQLHDPIQALIALERIKNEQSMLNELWPMLASFTLPLMLLGSSTVASKISPSYNFYWGDYVGYYDRRRQFQKVIWTVVILGLLVAVAANFVSKKLGI
jgi:hypothetical protein